MVEWSHWKKLKFSIPDNDKDTVKISTWLLILFLRYHGPKIHTERRNNNNNNKNNNNKNKIRTNSIGDMPLYGISPNNNDTICCCCYYCCCLLLLLLVLHHYYPASAPLPLWRLSIRRNKFLPGTQNTTSESIERFVDKMSCPGAYAPASGLEKQPTLWLWGVSTHHSTILPYFGKRKQVTYHPNLSYWGFPI